MADRNRRARPARAVPDTYRILLTTSLRSGRRDGDRGEEVAGSVIVGELSVASETFRALHQAQVPRSPHRPGRSSARGIAPWAGGYAVANTSQVFVYDRELRRIEHVHSEPRFGDIHSLVARDGVLYVTATASDSVLGFDAGWNRVFDWWAGREPVLRRLMEVPTPPELLDTHDFRGRGPHGNQFHVNHLFFDPEPVKRSPSVARAPTERPFARRGDAGVAGPTSRSRNAARGDAGAPAVGRRALHRLPAGDLLVNLPYLDVEPGLSKVWNVTRRRFQYPRTTDVNPIDGRVHDGTVLDGHHYFAWTEHGEFVKLDTASGRIVRRVDCSVPLGRTTGSPLAARHGWLRGSVRLRDELFLVGQSRLHLFLVDMATGTRTGPLHVTGVHGELDHPGLATYCIARLDE